MKGCDNIVQGVCTAWCFVALVLVGVSTALLHLAFEGLVEPVTNLPSSLRAGFQQSLGFSRLEPDALSIQGVAVDILGECGAAVSQCSNLLGSDTSVNVSAGVGSINRAFGSSLSTIELFANDPYLGIPEFDELRAGLRGVRGNLTQWQLWNVTEVSCNDTNPAFCAIHQSAQQLVSSSETVNLGLERLIDNEAVDYITAIADRSSRGLHVAPYPLWVSIAFYIGFFFKRNPSCHEASACCICTCHTIFFVFSMLMTLGFVILGFVVLQVVRSLELGDPFTGGPTTTELIENTLNRFPHFYDEVFKDLFQGMSEAFNAYLLFLVSHLMLVLHTSVNMCCCELYVSRKK